MTLMPSRESRSSVLLCKIRRRTVDGPLFRCVYITLFVDRLTEHVEHASKGRFTDRRLNGVAGGQHLVAAADALTRGEHDAAHGVAADVLCDLHHARLSVRCNGECFIYLRQAAAVKSNVHNRTCYLYHGTFGFIVISSLSMRVCRLRESGRSASESDGGAAVFPRRCPVCRRRSR